VAAVIRKLALAIGAIVAAVAAWPSAALAHGLVVRADLPIPTWLFAWAAVVVLVVTFVALATLWGSPLLEDPPWRPLPAGINRGFSSRAVEVGCGVVGVALLGVVVWSGFAGDQIVTFNFAPEFVYVIFWIGLVAASVLCGDVFRAFNPWRAVARVVGATVGRAAGTEPLPYPPWLGRWPAAVGLLGFVWLEVVQVEGNRPHTVAVATTVYSLITWGAMMFYGAESWAQRGEAFSVYFNLFSRMSVFERRDGILGLRPPLGGLSRVEPLPGTVAVVVVMIGTVSFDGGSGGPLYQSFAPTLQDAFASFPGATIEWSFGTGLFAAVAVIAVLYLLGIVGVRAVGTGMSASALARAFAPSLVPIAFAYVGAHYVSFLVLQGQAVAPLASDPLGRGWDLLGTASWKVNYSLVGAETFWYVQVALIVAGHVAALALAHDRALALFGSGRTAVRSQYPMLAVMVAFTCLALFLLSQANES
jgi:hypothetical protein